ncbi:SET domain group 26 isoform X2 [Wolffia australiana]
MTNTLQRDSRRIGRGGEMDGEFFNLPDLGDVGSATHSDDLSLQTWEILKKEVTYQQGEVPPLYEHIYMNEFVNRKHVKQREEDIAICVCQLDVHDPESACGDRCLNVLTSTECTPGYCPCGVYCKNQRFQKCEYPLVRLFKTVDRGWSLLAAQNIEAGQFVIEYCGEVISWKEARQRSHVYESQGESIDATKKGNLARFINHSCQPNCETRKWTVLGEVRVGIFTKQDILAGTELSYDYNFEWYGGAKVRCLCGAPTCAEFLGARSRGFQEAFYLWEDDDSRYSVDNIPLYDSGEEDASLKLAMVRETPIDVEPLDSMPEEAELLDSSSTATVLSVQGQSGSRKPHVPRRSANTKMKATVRRPVNVKLLADSLASASASAELLASEAVRAEAAAALDAVYDEIRPAIEEHERDTQDSVPTSVAQKWIAASCRKLKADLDLSAAIIRSVASHRR